MLTEIALSVGYASFFLWIIGRSSFFRDEVIDNRKFQWLFLIKILAGLGLFVIYTRFYSDRKYADIFRYYDDSRILFDSIRTHPYDFFRMITGYDSSSPELWQYYNEMNNWFNSEMIFNDARTMIRLNALFHFASAGTYYPHSIFFCFMGFTGLTAIYKTCAASYKENHVLIALIIFLMPGVLLWTSGVIKEAFLVFALGIAVYLIYRLAAGKGNQIKNTIGLMVSLFLLLNIKAYMFIVIIPGLFAWYITVSKKLMGVSKGKTIKKGNELQSILPVYFIVMVIYYAALYNFSPLLTNYSVPELMHNKQIEFYNLAQTEKAGSFVEIPAIDNTGWSLIKNAPHAFIYTLTRPTVMEVSNPMMLLAAGENALIVLLLLINIYFLFKKNNQVNGHSFLLLSILLIVSLFCLIGWVTPILGAVVRYKVPALPFLGALLVANVKWNRINNKASMLLNNSKWK